MFIDQNAMYRSTPGISPNTCPSLASSFSSSSDSPSMWGANIATPVSTPRRTPVNPEDSYISSTASFSSYYTPEKHGSGLDFCPNMSQDMPMGFQDSQMSFAGDSQPIQDQNMMGYGFPDYSAPIMQSCDGLPRLTPSLDFESCSPGSFGESSPTSADFVIPSQTTFDPFDMQSPMKQINSLHIDLQYTDDYANELMLNNSPVGSIRNYQGPAVRSCSSTPSRSFTFRQPICEPIQSAIALQRVQTMTKDEPRQKSEIKLRMHRRKTKRESRHPHLPENILHAEKADKPCLFPGCSRKFRRSEHLKRHARIHDPAAFEAYPCPFCSKVFDNRSDNLKQHVRIHADPLKKSARTTYIGQPARDWLAAKDKENRRSKAKKEEVTEI